MPEPTPSGDGMYDLLIRASFAPSSINEKARTARLVWSTGAPYTRRDDAGFFIETLSLDPKHVRLDRLKGAPLLNSHKAASLHDRLGVVIDAGIERGEGWADVKFSSRPDVEPFFRDVVEGIINSASVGYTVAEGGYRASMDPKTRVRTLHAVDWTPHEISLVNIPADRGATIRSETTMSEQVETRVPEVAPIVQPPTPPVVVIDEAAIRSAAITAERTRASTIQARTRAANLPSEVADKLVADGVALEHVGDRLIDEIHSRGAQATSPKVIVDNTDPTLIRERMEIALAARMTRGLPKEIKNNFTGDAIPVRVEITPEAKPYAGFRILDMMVELARASGHKIDQRQSANMVFDDLMKVRSLTTSDFPLLLAGASHRTLLAAYTAQQPTYQKLFGRKTFKDFRPHNFLRVGDFPALLKKNEAGEFKYGALGESGNSIIVGTYGRMVLVSRELIVNDDLGALSNLPASAGQKAAQFANETAFLQFGLNSGAGPNITEPNAAGVQTTLPLWHLTHGNLAAAGTAITVAALSAGRAALLKMTSVDGSKVGQAPTILLVSPDKLTEAEQIVTLLTSPTIPTEFNPFRGKLEVVVDANLTGNAWYLFVDPRVMETFVYGYMEGQEGPQYATEEQFTTLGVRFRVFLDFGAGALDFRGSYKNPGA